MYLYLSSQRNVKMAREIIDDDSLKIFVNTPIEVCEQLDPKGLYRKARAGEIKNFTGIPAPFEKPKDSFMEVSNNQPDIKKPVMEIWRKILTDIKLNA